MSTSQATKTPAETTPAHDLAGLYRNYAETAEQLAKRLEQLAQRADLSTHRNYKDTQPAVLAEYAEVQNELHQLAEPVQHQHLQHLYSTPVHMAKQLADTVDLSRPDKAQNTVRLTRDMITRLERLAEYAHTTANSTR